MRETIQVQKREFEERFAQEVETLKLYILDLKSRLNNYVPVKGDELDTKLGEFINGYKQKQQLKLMFLRLSEGNYEFGTRNLSLKLNRGMVFIKQGTNMTPIDQVLPNMLPEELAKFENRDPLKRLTGDAAAHSAIDSTSHIGRS